MRTVQMLGNCGVDVIDLPDPEPTNDDEVVVQVRSSPLCGSERHAYDGATGMDGRGGFNGGHEGAGVVARARGSKRLKEGDRVVLHAASPCGACRYCMAGHWVLCDAPLARRFPGNHSQYVLVNERSCLPLADDIDFETGALFGDAIGTPFRAIKRLHVSAFDTVLITGQGPIGLAATMLCRFLNARAIVLDVNDYRLERARQCGADVCINPSQEPDIRARLAEVAGPRGIDVALECSAAPEAQTLCLDALRKSGRMALVGVSGTGPTIDTMQHFTLKEIEVIGTWYSAPTDHEELETLARRGLPAKDMVTHRYGIEEAPEAFDVFFGGAGAKVVLEPWGD